MAVCPKHKIRYAHHFEGCWACEEEDREMSGVTMPEPKNSFCPVCKLGALNLPHSPDCLVKYPVDISSKPTNPKDIIGTDKVPLGLVPATSIAYQSLGHLEGMLKYGLVNWRVAGVRFSIYLDACLRHLQKLQNGEWADPVTRVPHLGNALACLGIIVDAYEAGKLIDDRPKSAPVAQVIDRLADNVRHLRDLYKDKHPTHFTIGYSETPNQRVGDEVV
jgi:hypothetical protein